MLFHTWVFAVFFVSVLPVHLALRRTRWADLWLLTASYGFYAGWNPLFLLLIAGSTAVDYVVVLRMQGSARRGRWLLVSLIANLGILVFFKYAGFITQNVNALLSGSGVQIPDPGFILPVGISFFTFQSMSYTIDAYRGEIETEKNFVRFAAYVALFPQLVAGPVERARNLLPQLRRPQPLSGEDFAQGASLFLVGLFKKVALADYLALYVDTIYDNPGQASSSALLLATFCFAWQIYFDFSGYTDMARGIARIMGFRLMVNFNNPYTAVSLGDFWRRWHISLSTWFRDYVYIPLGGNRHGSLALYRNIFVTMVVSGLWHGAAWGFIIWGVVHGLGRLATLRLESSTFWVQHCPRPVKQLLVFLFVCFAWVFFRAESLTDSLTVLRRITSGEFSDPGCPLLLLGLVTLIFLYQLTYSTGGRGQRVLESRPVRMTLALGMILWLVFVAQPATRPFIYFQF